MAMQLITDITLELTGDERLYMASAKQGDKRTRFIRIALTNNGKVFTIPTGYIVIANIKKPDKHFCYNECTVTENKVMVELTNQALAAAGTAHCDIEIRDAQNVYVLSSQAFTIEIEETNRNDAAIESCNEITALEKKVQQEKQTRQRHALKKHTSHRKNCKKCMKRCWTSREQSEARLTAAQRSALIR